MRMSRTALLKQLVRTVGRRRVAYECNVSAQAIDGWLAGAEPKARHILRLVELAELSPTEQLAAARKLAGLKEE